MEKAWADLQTDRIEAKYYPHWDALQEIRKFFIKHSEKYDYLVICSDDMIVTQKDVDMLLEDLETKKYKVISGMMNVDEKDLDDPDGHVSLSFELPSKVKKERVYHLARHSQLPESAIFPVKFSGLPLMAIHRDIAMQYPFDSDTVFKQNRKVNEGQQFDLVFCHYCAENDITVFVDKRINMVHLRQSGTHQVGTREPEVVFSEH